MINTNILNAVQMIRQNPMMFLQKNGINVSQDMLNDPNKIIQHLMNVGKVSQEDYDNAVRQAHKLGM
mgnify:CR=1 FL=1